MEKLYKIIGISCVVLFILFFIYAIKTTPKKFNMPDEKQAEKNAQWVNNNYMRFYSLQKKLGDDASPAEEAKRLLTECVSQMDIDRCEKVIDGKIFMGEPELWVLSSIGVYTHINTTTANGIVREQWVYGNGLAGSTYLYFDNKKLTGWQTLD